MFRYYREEPPDDDELSLDEGDGLEQDCYRCPECEVLMFRPGYCPDCARED